MSVPKQPALFTQPARKLIQEENTTPKLNPFSLQKALWPTQSKKPQVCPQEKLPMLYTYKEGICQYYEAKIQFQSPNSEGSRFRLFKDKDLGISRKFQHQLVRSSNDDDRQTTPSQLDASIKYTLQDLKGALDEGKMSQSETSNWSENGDLEWSW